MTPYAKVPGELVRIFFHSLLWPQRSLLYGFPPHCTKQSVFLTLQLDRICQNRVSYLSAMLFYRFYAALTGLLHGNHCYFARRSPFFGNPIIKYTKIDTGLQPGHQYLNIKQYVPSPEGFTFAQQERDSHFCFYSWSTKISFLEPGQNSVNEHCDDLLCVF